MRGYHRIPNPLPEFLRIRMIDRRADRFLVSSMRFVLLALAALILGATASAQSTSPTTPTTPTAPPKPPKTPTQLPPPKAEPANGGAYSPPRLREREGPSAADVGPVQRHFVRDSTIDADPTVDDDKFDNKALAIHEKTAIDKRITVPLIHDVQNDGDFSGGDNPALRYEITYLNWGAVTREQLEARRGHYFTITWDNDGPKDDFVARFEYREVKSKEVVRTLTQNMPHVSGAVRSYFAVTDQAYLAYGPIVSWRFTILKGDTVVAEAKSFIW
jgi:hypothetical protein